MEWKAVGRVEIGRSPTGRSYAMRAGPELAKFSERGPGREIMRPSGPAGRDALMMAWAHEREPRGFMWFCFGPALNLVPPGDTPNLEGY